MSPIKQTVLTSLLLLGYDPGKLYLFRGLGRGKFAASEVIKDEAGKPILKVTDQKNKVESFGTWMTLVDWDADGDLDILVGTFEPRIAQPSHPELQLLRVRQPRQV